MSGSKAGAYRIVIPARFASERLPGKVLLELGGEPLIQHAWRRAVSSAAEAVVIATDDHRVAEAARAFGAQVVLTRADHPSGSDRIAECANQLGWGDEQLVVNLQADEPMMPPACLDQVAGLLEERDDCLAASLYWPITDSGEILNPNVVKVVTDSEGRALYFSRAAIPFARAHADPAEAIEGGVQWKRHIGLYAYRLGALRHFTSSLPAPLERAERLEQLRIMEYGGRIAMARACRPIPAGIDTADDLERVRAIIESKK